MTRMKKLALTLTPLLMLGLVTVAGAVDKDEMLHGPTTYVPHAEEGGRAQGDDCTDPIVIDALPFFGTGLTNCGSGNNYSDTCLGSYDGGEDIMFKLILDEEATIQIHMDPLGTATWTGIAIDDQCPPGNPCIAFETGSSGPKSITSLNLAAGEYYIMVDTWPSPTCIPEFNLTVDFDDPPPPPPVNNTCDGAIEIERCTSGVVYGDLTSATNNYDPAVPGPSCTGWSAMGKDVTYVMHLEEGDEVSLFYFGGYDGFVFDESFYIVTDCSDMTTCLIGADNTVNTGETIIWTAPYDGTFFLICDAYGTDAGNTFELTFDITCAEPATGACCVGENNEICIIVEEDECDGIWIGVDVPCDPDPCEVTPTIDGSWGQIKNTYR